MATPDKTPQDPKADPAEPPKKKRGKLLLVIGMVTLLAGAGGGAAWYFTRPADPHAPKVAEKPKPAIFLPLESFTVNLIPADGQSQYVQAGISLRFEDTEPFDLVKERMPQVRDRVLMVLSAKRAPDLLSTQGKQKLAAEISEAVRTLILPAMKPVVVHAKPAAAEVAPVAAAHAADAPAATEEKPADAKSAEAKLVDAKSTEAKPADTKSADAKSPAAKPVPKGPLIEVLFTSFIIQ